MGEGRGGRGGCGRVKERDMCVGVCERGRCLCGGVYASDKRVVDVMELRCDLRWLHA